MAHQPVEHGVGAGVVASSTETPASNRSRPPSEPEIEVTLDDDAISVDGLDRRVRPRGGPQRWRP